MTPTPEGGSCGFSSGAVCADGLVCDSLNNLCRKARETGPCPTGFECDASVSFCDACTQTCTAKKAPGAACRGTDECATGVCHSTGCGAPLFGVDSQISNNAGFCQSPSTDACPRHDPTHEFAWEPTAKLGEVSALWGSSAADVYAVGPAGVVQHSAGDSTWKTQALPSMVVPRSVWGSGPNDVYVVGNGSSVYHSTGDGNWSATKIDAAGTMAGFFVVYGTSAQRVYVGGVCEKGTCIFTSTGDGVWTSLDFPLEFSVGGIQGPYIQSIWSPSADDVYVATGSGTFQLHAGTWSNILYGGYTLAGIGSNLYVGANQGLLTRDAGLWSEVVTPLEANEVAWSIAIPDPDTLFVVGGRNSIYMSAAGAWSKIGQLGSARIVWAPSKDEVYVAGSNGITRGRRAP